MTEKSPSTRAARRSGPRTLTGTIAPKDSAQHSRRRAAKSSQPGTQRLSKAAVPSVGKRTSDQTAKRQHTRQRKLHKVEPVPGEPGRYYVDSFSDPDGRYIVDVLEGTCPCKGFSVRKHCTHLLDATDVHEKREAVASSPPL